MKRACNISPRPRTKRAPGTTASAREPGVVGLCVAAFLAHGEDPVNGPYAKNIRNGIDYILSQQNEKNGYIGSSMYNHAFATKALAESYGVVDNPKIAPALKKAVELILSSQKTQPLRRVALHAGQPRCGHHRHRLPDGHLVRRAQRRHRRARRGDPQGPRLSEQQPRQRRSYGYTSASGGKPTLTAIGLLCLSLAKERDSKGYQASLDYLKKNLDYRDRYYPYYFEYYMSQALFHADEATWKEWNARNIRYLATIQSSGRLVSRQPGRLVQHRRRAAFAGPELPLSSRSTKNDPHTPSFPGCFRHRWLWPPPSRRTCCASPTATSCTAPSWASRKARRRSGSAMIVAAPVEFKTAQTPPHRPARRAAARSRSARSPTSASSMATASREPSPASTTRRSPWTPPMPACCRIPRKQVAMLAPNPLGGRLRYHGPFVEDDWKMTHASFPDGLPPPRRTPREGQGRKPTRISPGAGCFPAPPGIGRTSTSGTALHPRKRHAGPLDAALRPRMEKPALASPSASTRTSRKPKPGTRTRSRKNAAGGRAASSPGLLRSCPCFSATVMCSRFISTYLMLFRTSVDEDGEPVRRAGPDQQQQPPPRRHRQGHGGNPQQPPHRRDLAFHQ